MTAHAHFFAPIKNRDYSAPIKNRDYSAPIKNRDYSVTKAIPKNIGASPVSQELAEPYHPEYVRTQVKTELEREEEHLAQALSGWFTDLLNDLVSDEVQKAAPGQVLALLDNAPWWSWWNARLQEILTSGAVKAAQKGQATVERQLKMELSWAYLQPAVTSWADEHAAQLVGLIGQDVKEKIRQRILSGLAEQKTLYQIRDELGALTNNESQAIFSQARAGMIARTEVIRAHSQGAVIGYENSGVVRGIKWLDGQSGACPKCRELNNKVVPLGGKFYNDPKFGDGLPPRHPHCRCAVAPVTIDQAKEMPADSPLRDDRRDNIHQLTDKNTFAMIGDVRVSGERKRHWEIRHPETKGMAGLVVQGLNAPDHIKDINKIREYFVDLQRLSLKGRPLYFRIVVNMENQPFIVTAHITTQK